MLTFIKKYKYPIAIAILLCWVLFASQYNIFTVLEKRSELKNVEHKISFLEEEIKKVEEAKKALQNDPKELERQSRERYFMKKENEDVYVFDTVSVEKK